MPILGLFNQLLAPASVLKHAMHANALVLQNCQKHRSRDGYGLSLFPAIQVLRVMSGTSRHDLMSNSRIWVSPFLEQLNHVNQFHWDQCHGPTFAPFEYATSMRKTFLLVDCELGTRR
jgi:hypothetical protein